MRVCRARWQALGFLGFWCCSGAPDVLGWVGRFRVIDTSPIICNGGASSAWKGERSLPVCVLVAHRAEVATHAHVVLDLATKQGSLKSIPVQWILNVRLA